jgi:hypothetical protein
VAVLAGIDFFTVEVLTWRGLVTYYVLFSSTWRAGASAGRGSRGIQGKGNVLLFPSRRVGAEGRSPAENDSADCSDTTAAPHEYFGSTGCRSSRLGTGFVRTARSIAEAVLLTFNRGTPRSLDNDGTGPDHVFRYPQALARTGAG